MLDKSKTQNSYTFLRHLLAVSVLVSHVFGSTPGFEEIMVGNFSLGTLAVYCFFTISGYLVIPGLILNGIKQYLINRFSRIYPGYLFVMFLTSLIFYPIWRFQSQVAIFDWNTSAKYIIKNIVLVPQAATDVDSSWNSLSGYPWKSLLPSVVNGSIWTLPLEISAYLTLCLLLLISMIFKKYDFKNIVLIFFSIIWCLSIISSILYPELAIHHETKIEQLATKWPYLLAFMTGASLRLLKFKSISQLKVLILSCLILVGLQNILVWSLIGSVGLTVLILRLGDSNVFAKFNRNRDISYGIYLYHFPVIQVLSGFEIFAFSFGLKLFYTFLFTVVLAFMSSVLVEIPSQNYVKSRFNKKKIVN